MRCMSKCRVLRRPTRRAVKTNATWMKRQRNVERRKFPLAGVLILFSYLLEKPLHKKLSHNGDDANALGGVCQHIVLRWSMQHYALAFSPRCVCHRSATFLARKYACICSEMCLDEIFLTQGHKKQRCNRLITNGNSI